MDHGLKSVFGGLSEIIAKLRKINTIKANYNQLLKASTIDINCSSFCTLVFLVNIARKAKHIIVCLNFGITRFFRAKLSSEAT